jgi:ABC-type nickel/cobalt efflux system permease component RcnA
MGVMAGLIPCPLTLFLMFHAVSLGVPEVGLAFALAIVIGVGLVLASVAFVSVLAREFFRGLVRTAKSRPQRSGAGGRWHRRAGAGHPCCRGTLAS